MQSRPIAPISEAVELTSCPVEPPGVLAAGPTLEAARARDAEWRREQTQLLQRRIDRAARWETLGVWVSSSPLMLPLVMLLFGWAPMLWELLKHLLQTSSGEGGGAFFVGVIVGVILTGAALHRAARVIRHRWLAVARLQGLTVSDPGDDLFFSGRHQRPVRAKGAG